MALTVSAVEINLKKGNKPKYPLSLSHWTDAFHVFISIYLENFPTEAIHMLKYCNTVWEIHGLPCDVAERKYDEHFSRFRHFMNLPCQKPVKELRMLAIASQGIKAKFSHPFRKGRADLKGRNALPSTERDANHPLAHSHTHASNVEVPTQNSTAESKPNSRISSQTFY
jgi:hypothetical protein